MKYFNPQKKQSLPNKQIDAFLSELHFLCRKHKMCIGTSNPKFPLYVSTYSKKNVQNMLGTVFNTLNTKKEEEESENEK